MDGSDEHPDDIDNVHDNVMKTIRKNQGCLAWSFVVHGRAFSLCFRTEIKIQASCSILEL